MISSVTEGPQQTLQNKKWSPFTGVRLQCWDFTRSAFVLLTVHAFDVRPLTMVFTASREWQKRHNYSALVRSGPFLHHFWCLVMATPFPVSHREPAVSASNSRCTHFYYECDIFSTVCWNTRKVLCVAKNFVAVGLSKKAHSNVASTLCP